MSIMFADDLKLFKTVRNVRVASVLQRDLIDHIDCIVSKAYSMLGFRLHDVNMHGI